MNAKIRAGAALAATAAVVVLCGIYVTAHAARADGGITANTSCTSTSPCLTESNASTGQGVKSTSSIGTGLIAQTSALGNLSTNGHSGVLGQDLQTATGDGLFNLGVKGTSKNGTGVGGTGGTAGVTGTATTGAGAGVIGATTSLGGLDFEGSGQATGDGKPVFTLNNFGQAILGDQTAGLGDGSVVVKQHCGSGTPIFEGDNSDTIVFFADSCGSVEVLGSVFLNGPSSALVTPEIQGSHGVLSITSLISANNGLSLASGGTTNFTETDDSGVTWLYQGYSTTAGKYTIEMGDSGSIYARTFLTMVVPKVSQQTVSGARVDTYTPQITQPSLEDFGEAQLSGGTATVRLDPRFASAMDATTKYIVTLTPEGDCRGLYVARRDPAAFVVRELQGGRSSIAFSYRIVAQPLGAGSARLPLSTLPYEFTHAVPAPTKFHLPKRVVAPRLSMPQK